MSTAVARACASALALLGCAESEPTLRPVTVAQEPAAPWTPATPAPPAPTVDADPPDAAPDAPGADADPEDAGDARVTAADLALRQAAEAKATDAVAALRVVKSLCARARAQKASCGIGFADHPSESGAACNSSALVSSCFLTVSVMELHSTHATTLGTFLVDPKSFRVVGASGYCGPVPIAAYRGPGSGC